MVNDLWDQFLEKHESDYTNDYILSKYLLSFTVYVIILAFLLYYERIEKKELDYWFQQIEPMHEELNKNYQDFIKLTENSTYIELI